MAWSERLETAVVGITGLTTSDQGGTPEPGRPPNRRDCPPHPITAVVVRPWPGRDDGPGGNTGSLTPAPVNKPLPPFDADADRRLLETCDIKERKPQGSVPPPPQNTARAVHGPVLFTLRRFAWGTASRGPWAQEATGRAPVG